MDVNCGRGDHGGDAGVGVVALGSPESAQTGPLMRPAWLASSRGTVWHVADQADGGLAVEVACGRVVWAPVLRVLGGDPPEDATREVCPTCASMVEGWPRQDPDLAQSSEQSTDRLSMLRDALDFSRTRYDEPASARELIPVWSLAA